MIRSVLQESNSTGSVMKRLVSGKRTLMVQVRDKAWIISNGNEKSKLIPKTFVRSSEQDVENEQILKGERRVKSDHRDGMGVKQ